MPHSGGVHHRSQLPQHGEPGGNAQSRDERGWFAPQDALVGCSSAECLYCNAPELNSCTHLLVLCLQIARFDFTYGSVVRRTSPPPLPAQTCVDGAALSHLSRS